VNKLLLPMIFAITLLISSPSLAHASLIDDTIHVKQSFTSSGFVLCDVDLLVINGDENLNCGGWIVNIDSNSIWVQASTIDQSGFISLTWEFTSLDWVDFPNGVILDVTAVEDQQPIGTLSFDAHSISLQTSPFTVNCGGPPTCDVGFHLEIEKTIPIGGTLLPIDTTALLLAGAQMNAVWMIPVVAVGIGVGIYLVKRRF